MELAAPAMSYQDLLDAQKDLFKNQIEKLQQVVATQCKLTGVNPLSQEMAAGALSVKIGKRPRDLVNPKALKYMQSVFSIKDALSKRETREISTLFGVTLTQVRDFFMGQRSRVRKFVRLSKERDKGTSALEGMNNEIAFMSDPRMPVAVEPVPLDTIAPTSISEEPSCSKRHDILSGMGESDIQFVENIFSSMRKEESYSGQTKLLQWTLRIENSTVLHWFLAEGGLMILATWLSEAAKEEQTSFLHVILKLLDYLPMSKALPGHMSAILQSVNRLRFYGTSDISHRARNLLAKWSKMFGKNLSRKRNGLNPSSDLQEVMLLKQSINEVMGDDSWDLKDENSEEALRMLSDKPDNLRKLDSAQPLKMLTASGDDSNKRKGVLLSQTRERRKVQMVEQPGQRLPVRGPQVAKSAPAVQSRPLSADDIQKAKMRAQFLQNKHGKRSSCPDEKVKPENQIQCASLNTSIPAPVSEACDQTELEEQRKVENDVTKHANLPETSSPNLEELPWKKFKRSQIPWRIPPALCASATSWQLIAHQRYSGFIMLVLSRSIHPYFFNAEVRIREAWSVANGAESKELEVQTNRIRRERETVYRAVHEIPPDPREPWDCEMDYDDTLTPVIPTEQLPDDDPLETPASPKGSKESAAPSGSTSSEGVAEPDFQLLAELLKNPQLVFALTSGQASDLSNDVTVKLLDMIKSQGTTVLGSLAGNSNSKGEVSLPSPTPSIDAAPNGPKPDFTRNPFSRQQGVANGNAYHIPGAAPGMAPFQTQIPANVPFASQPLPAVPQPARTVAPLQASTKLPEHWKAPAPAHPEMLLPTRARSNSLNAQYLTTETILKANVHANSNQAPGVWSESISSVKPSPVSMVQAPSRSLTPPLTSKSPPKLPNSIMRHGFETKYGYNSGHVNNYNAYAGARRASVRPGTWTGRDTFTNNPGFESWSPDNSPSRHSERSSGQYYHEQDANQRRLYRPADRAMQQNPMQRSRYQDSNIVSRRWRNYSR